MEQTMKAKGTKKLKYPYQTKCKECGKTKAFDSKILADSWALQHGRSTKHKKVMVYDR